MFIICTPPNIKETWHFPQTSIYSENTPTQREKTVAYIVQVYINTSEIFLLKSHYIFSDEVRLSKILPTMGIQTGGAAHPIFHTNI